MPPGINEQEQRVEGGAPPSIIPDVEKSPLDTLIESQHNPEAARIVEDKTIKAHDDPSAMMPILPDPVAQSQNVMVQNDATPHSEEDNSVPSTNKDQIDKEWIAGLHRIVQATKDDPRLQKEELSRLKARYIKATFNKTIRVNGDNDS